MAHLCLSNSRLIQGIDFSHHETVNGLIDDPENDCRVLAPGPTAINLSTLSLSERRNLFPSTKRLIVFVIDGTWTQARRMLSLSSNLRALPRVCFTPTTPSQFWVRQQPAEHCYSTIEAIDAFLELVFPEERETPSRLLAAFSHMVRQQMEFEWAYGSVRGFRPTRGIR